jgi:hypothetical protein
MSASPPVQSQVSVPAPNGALAVAVPEAALKRKINLHAEKEFFFSAEEWDTIDLDTEDNSVLIGTPRNPIIRPGTKNLIEAPEKTFKTTFGLRQFLGMASGYTVYGSLPVARPVRILYMHGEMTPQELKERRNAAQVGIPSEFLKVGRKNFVDGRSIDAHLIRKEGQDAIRRVVRKFKPDVLVIDPWQSFIAGYDENSFKDMSQAQEYLDKLLAEQGGMTLFIVEHLGKDQNKGMRGHSSTSGWRDTLVRLKRKQGADGKIEVSVRPRWAAPLTFGVKFQDGTMVEGEAFSPQTVKIREFVERWAKERSKTMVPFAEIANSLGSKPDAARKAIKRAVEEEAIIEGQGQLKGSYCVFVAGVDDET